MIRNGACEATNTFYMRKVDELNNENWRITNRNNNDKLGNLGHITHVSQCWKACARQVPCMLTGEMKASRVERL